MSLHGLMELVEDELLPPGQVPLVPLGHSLRVPPPSGHRASQVWQRAARGLHQLQRGLVWWQRKGKNGHNEEGAALG